MGLFDFYPSYESTAGNRSAVKGAFDKYSNLFKGSSSLDAPQAPGVDSGLQDVYGQQKSYAQGLRKNMPGLMEQQQAVARGQGRGALASTLADTKRNFNSRGLLFSGLRQNAELGAAQNAASQLAGQTTDINRDLIGKTQGAEQAAIGTAGKIAQLEQDRENERVNSLLEAMKGRNSGLGSLGKGLGSVAGGIGGR